MNINDNSMTINALNENSFTVTKNYDKSNENIGTSLLLYFSKTAAS